jgi:hypothetical protein
MAHRIEIIGLPVMNGLLTKQAVEDTINLYYRWTDARFRVVCFHDIREMRVWHKDPKIKKTVRGMHQAADFGKSHTISLVRENIEKAWEDKIAAGGNIAPPTLKAAPIMVLIHEIQHANQIQLHAAPADGGRFWNERGYHNRACEREARTFVDEHLDEVCAYLGLPPVRDRRKPKGDVEQEIDDVVDLLCECSEVTMEDVREELRASKILNPKNVTRVLELLQQNGFDIQFV